jgi:hypothetical protein
MRTKYLIQNFIALVVVAVSFNSASAQNLNSAIDQSAKKQNVHTSNVESNASQPIQMEESKSAKHLSAPEVIKSGKYTRKKFRTSY